MTFQISTTGAPTFQYVMQSDNTCATTATVRLFLQRRNDDLTEEFYRWWSNPTVYDLQATPGDVTLTVPITPDQWSSVYGKFGSQDATTLAGFQDALSNLGHVGMTFGGGCFFGHGVNGSGGPRASLSLAIRFREPVDRHVFATFSPLNSCVVL